jgi:replicative DNA helicase
MLLDKNTIDHAQEFIVESDFYLEKNRIIFKAICELSAKGVADIRTLTTYLRDHKVLDKCGGVDYLNEILDIVPTATNIEYYAKIVKEKSQLRTLITTAKGIINKSLDETLEAKRIIEEAEQSIFQISQREVSGDFRTVRSVIMENMEKIIKMMDEDKIITGLPTGFHELDIRTDGFHESEFIIIAARPSMGKTAFAMNIAEHMAIKEKLGVAIFSLEMPADLLTMRMMSSLSGLNNNKIRRAQLNQDEVAMLYDAADKLGSAEIYIMDNTNMTVFDMRSRLRKLISDPTKKINIVFVDYLQLMKHPAFQDNRQQEIAEISRSLKALARDLKIPVVAISQLNRKVDDRKEREPQLSDLRESGAIEQDADLVLFIDRKEYYLKEKTPENEKGKADILIMKNRNGPMGHKITLGFKGDLTKFIPLTLEEGR